IDITDILIINSVDKTSLPLNIYMNDNLISIISSERIKKVEVYDLLGNKIVENYFHDKNIELKNNFYSNYYFLRIQTENNIYSTKILKEYSSNIKNNFLIMNENNWKITLYKYAFKTTTLEYDNIPSQINHSMKRLRIEI